MTKQTDLRWGAERQLEFIEFCRFWDGLVSRRDLTDQFGVSVNQASTELNRYIGLAPDNMVYDKSARTYFRGPELTLEIAPPALLETHAKAIALDRDMRGGKSWIKVRCLDLTGISGRETHSIRSSHP